MKKNTLILVAVAIVIGFAAFWFFGTNKAAAPAAGGQDKTSGQSTSDASEQAGETEAPVETQAASQATITYENGKFTPDSVTLASGGTITWINKSSQVIAIGTDPHPSHTGNREVSNGAFTLDVPGGGQAASTLKTTGSHSFHDHLNPSASGTITVR